MSNVVAVVRVDEGASTFILFVMLLVVAVSSMLASNLPLAMFAATAPVTIAVALDFALRGGVQNYILSAMTVTAQAYFTMLAQRLYWTTLATLEARAEKDALIGELEQAKSISDEAPRRGRQYFQVALPGADEPRTAHAAQRDPRIFRSDEERGVRAARGADLQGIRGRHP
jgi:hypothetical protein